MQHTRGVRGGERIAELHTDRNRFVDAEHTVARQALRERRTGDELHRETHLRADLLGIVDGDDAGMANPCEQAALAKNGRRTIRAGTGAGGNQLEGRLAVQPRIPRAIDLAERATADALDQPQPPPILRRLTVGRSRRGGGWRQMPMKIRDRAQQAQFLEELDVFRGRAALQGRPVDGGSLEDCGGDGIRVNGHGASPRLVARARARWPSEPLRRWSCRRLRQARHTCNPSRLFR